MLQFKDENKASYFHVQGARYQCPQNDFRRVLRCTRVIARHSSPSLLQRTADKATANNLKFSFLEKNMVQQGLIEKFILAFSTTYA